jgi:plastocyanin
MTRQPIVWSVLASVAGGSIALGAVGQPAPRAPATYTVVIDKMAFGATPNGAHVGDTIIWVNRDMFRHTATASDHSFNLDLMPGKSGRIVLKRAGRIAFACTFHPGMKGVIAVAP